MWLPCGFPVTAGRTVLGRSHSRQLKSRAAWRTTRVGRVQRLPGPPVGHGCRRHLQGRDRLVRCYWGAATHRGFVRRKRWRRGCRRMQGHAVTTVLSCVDVTGPSHRRGRDNTGDSAPSSAHGLRPLASVCSVPMTVKGGAGCAGPRPERLGSVSPRPRSVGRTQKRWWGRATPAVLRRVKAPFLLGRRLLVVVVVVCFFLSYLFELCFPFWSPGGRASSS